MSLNRSSKWVVSGSPLSSRWSKTPKRIAFPFPLGSCGRQYRVCDLFGSHQGREVRVGAWHRRKQRGIDNPQPAHPANSALIVGHRHRIVLRTHPASAGGMPDTDRGFADKVFERLVVAHQLIEPITLYDYLFDHHAPQPWGPIEQFCDDVGNHLVLAVDDADLADAL